MSSHLIWPVALAPLSLIALGFTPSARANLHPKGMLDFAGWLCGLSVLTAAAVLAWIAFRGALATPLAVVYGLGFSLYLDSVSSSMFALVSFIGLYSVLYSRNYLAGDRNQGRFVKWICLTIGSVLFLIVSGNLLQLFISWIGASLSLNELLLFYRERPAAVLAARKKWFVSRVGDVCLLAAMILVYRTLGSLEYVSIFEVIKGFASRDQLPPSLGWAASLLAFAAMLKSAQFPVHGWLLEVMETPTPVSALLHAGVINAGGFLMIRFSGLVVLSPVATNSLLLVGAVTALFGSVVMLAQTSVKSSLAYSTIAQMGFMMLECGLGIFSAAMLHILAHSLYKAHAFLSSGSAVELAQLGSDEPRPPVSGSRFYSPAVVVAALLASLAAGALLRLDAGIITLGCIFAIGAAVLAAAGLEGPPEARLGTETAFNVIGVVGLFYGVQYLAEVAFSSAVAHRLANPSALDICFRIAIVASFGLVAWFQKALFGRDDERWLALYVHVLNGFYVNTVANRLAVRFWLSPAPRPSVPSYVASAASGRPA